MLTSIARPVAGALFKACVPLEMDLSNVSQQKQVSREYISYFPALLVCVTQDNWYLKVLTLLNLLTSHLAKFLQCRKDKMKWLQHGEIPTGRRTGEPVCCWCVSSRNKLPS